MVSWILRFYRFICRNKLSILIAVAGMIIAIIFFEYILTFNGGLSDEHRTWGEFGSLFGAITGLISFIGVLLTLIQSKKMGIVSEERASFFKMFELFNENRSRLTIPEATFTDDEFFSKKDR